MKFIFAIVIIIVVGIILYIRRREHLNEAHRHVAIKKNEKNSWNKEKYRSYGEIQELRKVLEREVQNSIADKEKIDVVIVGHEQEVYFWANDSNSTDRVLRLPPEFTNICINC